MLLWHSSRIPFALVRKNEREERKQNKREACRLFVRTADMTWAGMLTTPLPWQRLHGLCF